MAATKSTKPNRKRSASTKGSASSRKKKSPETNGFQTEIILLVALAASVIFLVSNFGLGGVVGNSISNVCFGIMGLMAYIFPIILFIGTAFLVSNRTSSLAVKKSLAAAVLFLVLCGFFQLASGEYAAGTSFTDFYLESSSEHMGGGVIGGAICYSLTSAFGAVGGCVILVMVLLACVIIITQKSLFGFLFHLWDAFLAMIRGGRERYAEGEPERALKKELKEQQKHKAREERRAVRMRRLEEEIAAQEAELAGDIDEELLSKHRDKLNVSGTGKHKSGRSRTETRDWDSRRAHTRRRPDNGPQNLAGFLAGTTLEKKPEEHSPEEAMTSASGKGETGASCILDNSPTGVNQLEFPIHRAEPLCAEDEAAGGENPHQDFSAAMDNEKPAADNRVTNAAAFQAETLSGSESDPDIPSGKSTPENQRQTADEVPASRQSVKNPKSSKQEIENGIVNIQHEINNQEAAVKKEYQYPPLKLLKRGSSKNLGDSDAHLRKTAQKLHDTLANFGVNVTITNVSCGPTVTRYELAPEQGVKVSKIVGLADDIKLNLAAADIRIEAPIPGKAAVGIEVPNKETSAVMLRDLIQSQEFQSAKSKLSFATGKDIAGKPVVSDIAKMPHLLIAGATGSGKSVCINTLIISLLYKAGPEDVRLIMIDPKVVELSVYNGIPHLLIPVVTDPKKAAGALNWAVTEMTNRYNAFAEYGVRNLEEYNRKIAGIPAQDGQPAPEKMPQIVIIVDELADLMMVAPGEVEDAICRLAQLARAAGIHLIIATQRPSVNVITGLIKANMPSRIAFSVSSGVDSRTILDMNGAEKLLGKGDMLFYPQGYTKPARLQGSFVSDEEVEAVVNFLADKNPAQYSSKIEEQMKSGSAGASGSGGEERDVYFEEAGKFIIEKDKASIGMLQRMFKIGFNRAARIMDQLSDAGVVGPEEGTKPRKILMSQEQFEQYIEEYL